jgi:membrane associated rhomboid family serine protease
VAGIVIFFAAQGGQFTFTGTGATDATTARYGLVPGDVRWYAPLTAMFLHGGVVQLACNALLLWIFGATLEGSMGHVRFLAFYVLGGLAASGLTVAIHPGLMTPVVGSSGAVAAVIAGYLVVHPRGHVLTLVVVLLFGTVLAVPALLFGGVWLGLQAVYGALDLVAPGGSTVGLAYAAQAGGLLAGVLLARAFARRAEAVA